MAGTNRTRVSGRAPREGAHGPLTRVLVSTPVLRVSCVPLDLTAGALLALGRATDWLNVQRERLS